MKVTLCSSVDIDVDDLDEATRIAVAVREHERANIEAIATEFDKTAEELGFHDHKVWIAVMP